MGREREQGTGMQLFKSRCKRAGASSGECLGGCLGWLGASALRPGRGRAETASGSVASIATSKHEGGPTRVFDGSDGSLGGGWCGAPSTAAVPAGCRPHPVADSAWLAVLASQQYEASRALSSRPRRRSTAQSSCHSNSVHVPLYDQPPRCSYAGGVEVESLRRLQR